MYDFFNSFLVSFLRSGGESILCGALLKGLSTF
jgi:hypothetical protein